MKYSIAHAGPCAFGVLVLVLAGCTTTRQSTSELTSRYTVTGDRHAIVLPKVAEAEPYPTYSRRLLRDGREGMVEVDCVVDTSGQVMAAHVHGAPDPQLAKMTLAAVERWRFTPGMRDGVPIAMQVVIPVEYRIRE